ncbi:RusA family crossover junction endodeoxyribonuclease [Caproiciproducens sp.]
MKFTISIAPVTKKNHQQIRRNHKTGKPFIAQSDQYIAYENACLMFISSRYKLNIDCPVNLCAKFFMPSQRRVDLVNLIEAIQDVLVKAHVLADDNCKIVVTTDGSRVLYDKDRPRTEVTITEVGNA